MYKSPISVECEKIAKEITEKQDGYIVSETIRLTGVKVDKDELIKALSYDRGQYEKGYADGKADAEEVRRGRWLHLHLDPDNITGHTRGECSICGKLRIVDNYCPNCGAKMDEVEE